jgi:hypothetical protein
VGVEANGVEAGVAEHVGDGDEVGAATDEGGGEGMPPDVGSDAYLTWEPLQNGASGYRGSTITSGLGVGGRVGPARVRAV